MQIWPVNLQVRRGKVTKTETIGDGTRLFFNRTIGKPMIVYSKRYNFVDQRQIIELKMQLSQSLDSEARSKGLAVDCQY